MRLSIVVLLAMVLGVGLGIGTTWAKYGWPDRAESLATKTTPDRLPTPAPPEGPQPAVFVEEEEYNFGAIESGATVTHVFLIRNVGDYPLALDRGGTSCGKCTIASLSKSTLRPGDVAEVTVEYSASMTEKEFRQEAVILTNDPDRPRVSLTVLGKLTSSIDVVPEKLVFSRIAVNDTKRAEVKVYANLVKDFEIIRHEFTEPESANYFSAAWRPMTTAEIAESPEAKGGVVITVEVKPGMPLGPIRQRLRLHSNSGRNNTIDVYIEGTVVSEISIVGPGWNSDTGTLSLGVVDGKRGGKIELALMVRGPGRHDVKIRPERTSPSLLRVTIGEQSELSRGALVKIPLFVEVPAGTPAMNRLGAEQGALGEIVLETTHPNAKKVRMLVRFAVEN